MKWLLPFIFIGVVNGATIIGDLRNQNDVAVSVGNVVFHPLSTPLSSADGTKTYLDYTKTAKIYYGKFTNYCVGGFYDCEFVGSKTLTILVPTNDASQYQFDYVAQLATNAPTFTYPTLYAVPSRYLLQGTNILFQTNNAGQASETLTINGTSVGSVQTNINQNQLILDKGFTNMLSGQRTVLTPYAYSSNFILLTTVSFDGNYSILFYKTNDINPGVSFVVKSSSGVSNNTNGFVWAVIQQ